MLRNIVLDDTPYTLPSDWRGVVMSQIRKLFTEADPQIVEEVKYKTASNPGGVLVWYCDGMVSTGEIYKKHLRLTLTKGHLLKDQDPTKIINSYRAILIQEGDKIDEVAFKNLIRAAVAINHTAKGVFT